MPTPQFTHLHAHTHYSLLDGLGKIPDIIQATKQRGMDSIAITDHGNMYGAIEFYQHATQNGIKPIIGEEMYLAPGDHRNKRGRMDANPFHMILLATNEIGYKNLIQLTTHAHLEGFYYKPRIDKELLKKYNEGLIALSGCLGGIVSDAILHRGEAEAKKEIQEFQQIFGDRYYLEVQHHPTEKDQLIVNEALFRFSKELGIKPVATADFHYIDKGDAENHDILLCIQTNKTVDDRDRMDLRQLDLSLKSPEQMAEEFQNHPEAIESTQEIAARCNLEIKLGQTLLPSFQVPDQLTPEQFLRNLCLVGIAKRYNLPETAAGEIPEGTPLAITERLDYELSVINQTGFASYFLIVQDFVNYAKNIGIQVGPGRGSAAGSLVAYLLNITNLDPLKYDLLFERFLNPERISMPDIDLDFADDRRDEVLRYVEKKYGRDHVAQIITFGTLAARMAVRDAGRALGLPYAYPDKVAKLIPMFRTLSEAIDEIPELKALYENEIDAKRIIDAALKLEGVARHASIHACGVVISKEALTEYLPLQLGEKNENTIVTQYSLHPVEDIGLLKMDFLGLKNLTIIQNTINIIKRTKTIEIDINQLDLNDQKSYELFQKGHTTGVFQFESAGMKRYLMQLKPTNIEDLIAMVALYRPGPMEQIPAYIEGKKSPGSIRYAHPKLEPILKKTYGVGIYQEQIMQIARDLAGFTLGEADVLRKAMGKKIKALLNEQKTKFVAGCEKNGIDKNTATKIFEFIEPFAGYGFNRSHAACYALVGFQTAYLKAHFPAEFMAALLTSDEHDADRVAIEVEETRAMGIPVLPPDVNSSFSGFTVVQNPEDPSKEAIRFGLSAIKNVGDNAVASMYEEREKNGPFTDMSSLVTRVQSKDMNRKSLESLAKSGALDSIAERNQVLENMDMIIEFAKRARERILAGQTDIFGALGTSEGTARITLKNAAPASKQQRLAWEKELLGLYVSEHPMNEYMQYFPGKASTIQEATTQLHNQEARVCGIITKIQKIWTRKQQAMLFVTIEDTSGALEVLVFPKVLEEEGEELWKEENILIIEGTMSDKDGIPKMLANKGRRFSPDYMKHLRTFGAARASKNQGATTNNPPSHIEIHITPTSSAEHLKNLKELLEKTASGPTHIRLMISSKDASVKRIETKYKIGFNPDIVHRLENIVGQGMVQY